MSIITAAREGEVLVVELENAPAYAFSTKDCTAMAAAAEDAAADDGLEAKISGKEQRFNG